MSTINLLLLVIYLVRSVNSDSDRSWMDKHIPTPIEYTVYNEVSVVHNTKIDFSNFKTKMKEIVSAHNLTFSESDENQEYPIAVVREALSQYLFPLVEIDPVKPGDAHLYNAEYEHKKEVFGHKAVKDFIIRESKAHNDKKAFSLNQISEWFKPTKAP